MSINKLPSTFKPDSLCKKAASTGTVYSGEMPVASILNLSNELKKHGLTPVSYTLRFYVDSEGYPVIEGEMVGDFELVCQRCLEPMKLTVKAEILVSPVASDAQAKQLPERYEPLLMTEGELNFAEWIAEELHLALPLVPRHKEVCISHESYTQGKTDE